MLFKMQCSLVPPPPDAITGIANCVANCFVMSSAKPLLVPSWFIEVSRISPAPRCFRFFRPAKTFPFGFGAAAVQVHIPGAVFFLFASIATTTHWLPALAAISVIRAGIFKCRRVDGNFIRTGIQQHAYIFQCIDAAAYGKRNIDIACHALYQLG
jgi:hypothetical protein